ncbi:MAG: type IX secretion system outer membrane channel protein PorV [Sodaliphilus pleomorphus]|uniref:type IX secretion system outer membrane channel protein PorV n=1 Tax=Sodaliphilus pleomorphus TaxID=2606626 RepID=UPI0023F03436|nr:type IX secretion system outer membrane channel protein PorV [Sodaliphilus pleomorphus]MDD7066230.1 type IX secretion system outer membrane channel protein PorV [Sodaliphilus pleomorphus]MDY2831504.1 type IX secretion system outer membrane channel protein PorV [Sodaliphilus pleomorphus]MDY6251360.1 type IX secretion system outer membrane channel protein PorV [Bacteroidales bacterium]
MKLTKTLILVSLAMAGTLAAQADDDIKNTEFNPVTTGVTSLGITPDARGASMGDLGVATDPDVNSQFWNPAKYAFAYSTAGASLSYTPWLRKIVNDIYLANLAGYWKIGGGDNQAVSASMRYFSLGEIQMTGDQGSNIGSINPYEMAVDVAYSRKLSEKFSMAVALRYIYSNLGYSEYSSTEGTTGASAFAADIAGYYTTYPVIGRNECQWSLGWNLSNIGSKVSYDHGDNPAFLPANLRIGTAFTFPLADYHNLTVSLDANKLLVPAKPRLSDYSGEESESKYEEDLQKWKDKSSISGIFDSFDKDWAKRITESIGLEYAYNQQFFLRAGYFHESKFNGNRQYFGMGAGFALNVIKIDASYMIATAQNSPLDQTLRFTLSFDLDGIKGLFGRR